MSNEAEAPERDCAHCHAELDDVFGPVIDENEKPRRVLYKSLGKFSRKVPAKLGRMLEAAMKATATDVHLKTGETPYFRISGRLVAKPEFGTLSPDYMSELVEEITSRQDKENLEMRGDCDLGIAIEGIARFRVNVFVERNNYAIALRLLPSRIPEFEDLGLPVEVCKGLASLARGLVLVTGPTGSGKTTTLAAMINYINRNYSVNVVTIEDPIEYIHVNRKALISQREVGRDAITFDSALRSALRQDPDVILVGEMRDLETIRTALTAAETGHLVLCTLHTNSATSTIERIIDVFPSQQQAQIRLQLSMALAGILTQALLPGTHDSKKDRVLAVESLIVTPAVRNMVRECKTYQLYSLMQSGKLKGMQTLDSDLARLVREGLVDLKVARAICHHPEEFSKDLIAYA